PAQVVKPVKDRIIVCRADIATRHDKDIALIDRRPIRSQEAEVIGCVVRPSTTPRINEFIKVVTRTGRRAVARIVIIRVVETRYEWRADDEIRRIEGVVRRETWHYGNTRDSAPGDADVQQILKCVRRR